MGKKSASLLIVDDDPEVLSALDAELQEDYDVTPVSSAEQALAHLQSQEFAAIISDVRMPGVDGLSLIKQCAVRYPNMVRILLTAFDGEDVMETAMGPHGAFKLVKPWGDDLLITLSNALYQRDSTMSLRRHLDLKTELLDIDRRLHFQLSEDALLTEAANEMLRHPEVEAATLYELASDGEPTAHLVVKETNDGIIPEYRKARATPVEIEGHYHYTVPLGNWSKPIAAFAVVLAKKDSETIRYVDFVARQAFRTLRIIRSNSPEKNPETRIPICPDEVHLERYTLTESVVQELTTPTTVLGSAIHALTQLINEIASENNPATKLPEIRTELGEINDDVSMVHSALKALLERFKAL